MGYDWPVNYAWIRFAAPVGLVSTVACSDPLPEVTAESEETSNDGASTSSGAAIGPPVTTTGSIEPEPDTTAGLDTTESASSSSSSSGTGEESSRGSSSGGGSSSEGSSSSTGPEPQQPVAVDDVACMIRGSAFITYGEALANDSDPQGSPLSIIEADPITAEGGFTFVVGDDILYAPPDESFWGEDWLSYTIEDPDGNTASAELHVMVWPGEVEASELLADQHGLAISPDVASGRLGWAVGGGGDLNDDGIDDVVVSAPYADSGIGRIYAIYGGVGVTSVELAEVAASVGGFVMQGEHVNAFAGWSTTIIPDLDGDARDEVVVGSAWANLSGSRSGRVYVVFSPGTPAPLDLFNVAFGGGYVIDGAFAEDWTGWSVSGAPDMNGDGLGELLVGSPQATDVFPDAPGLAYVVWGKADTAPVPLLAMQLGLGGGFAMLGGPGSDHIGFSVQAAGDLDGDGYGELLLGSEVAAGGAGRAYLVRGKADDAPVELGAVAAEMGGYRLEGQAPGVELGRGVGAVGDLDGNGVPEIVVGAPGPAGLGDGAAHIVYDAVTGNLTLGTLAAADGVSLATGEPGDDLGWSVKEVGDFNADGWPDLALGAPGGDSPPDTDAGLVYVVFGRADMSSVSLADVAEGRGGFVVSGEGFGANAGYAVSTAGDFNGDGADDLLLGAPMTESLNFGAGRAYVVFGVPSSTPELGACVPL